MEEDKKQETSILAIDHPTVPPPQYLARIQSFRLIDQKLTDKTMCYTMPQGLSLQNFCNNMLFFANHPDSNETCLLDLVSCNVLTLPISIPVPNITFLYGMGFDPKSNTYKTVRMHVAENEGNEPGNHVVKADINRLGQDSWDTISGSGSLPTGSVFGKPVSVDGFLVWGDFRGIKPFGFPVIDATTHTKGRMYVFDLCEEKFFSIKMPYVGFCHLVTLNGKLCVVELCESYILIRVSPNLDGSWEPLGYVKIDYYTANQDHRKIRVIGMLENGKLLLKNYYTRCYVMYDLVTSNCEPLQLPFRAECIVTPESKSRLPLKQWLWFL